MTSLGHRDLGADLSFQISETLQFVPDQGETTSMCPKKQCVLWCVQIVEGNALPTLIFMLRSEDVGIHYEAVYSETV